jgi:predicted HTH domain antitoxin
MTEKIAFEISQDILASLKIGIGDLLQNMRLITAINYFTDKKLSLGKASELAGYNRLEFMDILAQKGIVIFDYDESMVENELQGICNLSR